LLFLGRKCFLLEIIYTSRAIDSPGTGKTVTVVEAIMQLTKKNANIRMLVCAPSNSAADLIASRLIDCLGVGELFRMYAPSRDEKQVPDLLRAYSYYRDDGSSRPCFSVPPMATMKNYRVIVSTLISASIAFGIGMPRGHFSHIFIDEAGQATEPEAFVSIKTLADPKTNIVLSGDPKQLGPIIRSGISTHLGLELSYIERIMARPPYDQSVGHGKRYVFLFTCHFYVICCHTSEQYRQARQEFPLSWSYTPFPKREVLRQRSTALWQ